MFMFSLLFIGHLLKGISANTEIINFSATAAEFSSLPFTETWCVANFSARFITNQVVTVKKAYIRTREFNLAMEYDFCSSGTYAFSINMPRSSWMASNTERECLPARVLARLGFRSRWMEGLWQVHSSTFLACFCAFTYCLIGCIKLR